MTEWLHSFPHESQPPAWDTGLWDAACSLVTPPCPGFLQGRFMPPRLQTEGRFWRGHSAIYCPCQFTSYSFWNAETNRGQPCLEEDLFCILLFASYKRPVRLPTLPSTLTSLRCIPSPTHSYHYRDFSKLHTSLCHPGLKLLQCLLMSVTVPDAYSVPGVQDTQNSMPGGDSLENKVSKSMNKGVHMNNDCHEGKSTMCCDRERGGKEPRGGL